jgi:hypothetical protein
VPTQKLALLTIAVFALALVVVWAPSANADGFSTTGSLLTPETPFIVTFTLGSTSSLDIQSWGFGGSSGAPGGTDFAGQVIGPGGFDPLMALYQGTGSGATLVMDGGNPAVSADNLTGLATNFTPSCPPGTAVSIGGPVCGDPTLLLASLAAGTYTILLTDANYIPNSINGGALSLNPNDFSDLTGGVFQTCNFDPVSGNSTCQNDSSNFAFDVTFQSKVVATPEPASLLFLATGLVGVFLRKYTPRRRTESGSV